MSKHFHGTAHFKAGFDIDESTLHPNANYWRRHALGQQNRLARLVGEDKATHLTNPVEGTWKEIYESIQLIADLAEKQVQRSGWIDDTFEGYKPLDILSSGFAFNSKRLDVYNHYCADLAKKYNALMQRKQADRADLLVSMHPF